VLGSGVSLVLIALGAILVWAVNADVRGVNVHTVGWILMAVGFVGFLLALAYAGTRRRSTVYDDRDPLP
jgi:hypothetical protein